MQVLLLRVVPVLLVFVGMGCQSRPSGDGASDLSYSGDNLGAVARGATGADVRTGAADRPGRRIVLAEEHASTPTAAVDAERGTAYFAWFGRDEEGKAAVLVSRLASGRERPSSPVPVSGSLQAVNPHPQAPPQVAAGPGEEVYVAWSSRIEVEGRRFPASNVLLARSTDGGRSFEDAIFVNRDAGGPPGGHTFHNLAVGPDGRVYVSWLESRDASIDPHDHAAQHAHASNTVVRVARSDDHGQTFSEGVIVARGTCQCCRTALHVDERGTVFVAWRHIFGTSTRDIAVARSEDGGVTFSSPARVHVDNWSIEGCPHSGPALAMDGQGRLHVAWYTAASEERTGLFHTISKDGGRSFEQPASLEAGVPIASAQLAVDGEGAWIAWEDPTEGRIYAGRSVPSAGTHASRAERERTGDVIETYQGSAPSIAAAEGMRVVAWQHDGRILAAVNRW